MPRPFAPHPALALAAALAACAPQTHPALPRVKQLARDRQYDAALSELQIALRQDPADPSLLRQQIALLIDADRPDLAAGAWADLRDPSDPTLLQALRSPAPATRASAAKAVAMAGGPRTTDALRHAAADPDPMVRRAAVHGLATPQDPPGPPDAAVIQALLAALKDPAFAVRADAAQALGHTGAPAALPALLAAVRDTDPHARAQAMHAALALARPEHGPLLMRELRRAAPDVRTTAALCLAKLGDHSGAEAMRDAMVQHPDRAVRRACIEHLAKLRDPAHADAFRQLLADPDPQVVFAAVTALGYVPDSASVAPLARLSKRADIPENLAAHAAAAADGIRQAVEAQRKPGRSAPGKVPAKP